MAGSSSFFNPLGLLRKATGAALVGRGSGTVDSALTELTVRQNALSRAVRVLMTGAPSGSGGINAASGISYEPGTDNIFLWWLGALPDWTPAATVYLFSKRQDANNHWGLQINTDGTVEFSAVVGGASVIASASSTIATGQTDGDIALITCSITREAAASAGSIEYGVNGLQLGATKTITAASTVSLTNTGRMEICGRNGARYACTYLDSGIYNRALSAGEVLSFAKNGPDLSDIGASQVTPVSGSVLNGTSTRSYSSFSSGSDNFTGTIPGGSASQRHAGYAISVVSGGKYRIKGTYSITGAGSNFRISVAASLSDTAQLTNTVTLADPSGQFDVTLIANTTGNGIIAFALTVGNALSVTVEVTNIRVHRVGMTCRWNAENAQSNTGQILGTSGNKNHALLPAAGATVFPAKNTFEVRSTHTWSGTSEAQYLTGVNQNVVPTNAYIESVLVDITGTPVDGVLGSAADADEYATLAQNAGLIAGVNSLALVKRTIDTADQRLIWKPSAAFTGTASFIVTLKLRE